MDGQRVLRLIAAAVCAALLVIPGCAPADGPLEPVFDEGTEVEAVERALRDLGVPVHDGVSVLMKEVEPGAAWTYEQVLADPYERVVEWHRREYAAGGWTLAAGDPVEDERLVRLEFRMEEGAASTVDIRGMDDGRTTVAVSVRTDGAAR
ncbi:MAG: hypothetical protein ACNA76_01465 [Anaerosomatales bacterium]